MTKSVIFFICVLAIVNSYASPRHHYQIKASVQQKLGVLNALKDQGRLDQLSDSELIEVEKYLQNAIDASLPNRPAARPRPQHRPRVVVTPVYQPRNKAISCEISFSTTYTRYHISSDSVTVDLNQVDLENEKYKLTKNVQSKCMTELKKKFSGMALNHWSGNCYDSSKLSCNI